MRFLKILSFFPEITNDDSSISWEIIYASGIITVTVFASLSTESVISELSSVAVITPSYDMVNDFFVSGIFTSPIEFLFSKLQAFEYAYSAVASGRFSFSLELRSTPFTVGFAVVTVVSSVVVVIVVVSGAVVTGGSVFCI